MTDSPRSQIAVVPGVYQRERNLSLLRYASTPEVGHVGARIPGVAAPGAEPAL